MNKYFSLITILFFLCFYSQNYSISTIPENLKKNANVVVRNEQVITNIKSIDDMEIETNLVLSIFSKSAEKYSTIVIPYTKSWKVSDIKVEVLDEAGKVIEKFSKSDFKDFSNPSAGTLYMDHRVLVLNYLAKNYPFTLKYKYSINTSNTVFLPKHIPFDDYNVSLEHSNYIINNNSGIKLRTKITDSEIAKVSKTENGNHYEFSFNNIEALNEEKFAPSLSVVMPKVEFSLDNFTLEGKKGDLSNWNNFGNWYYNNLLVPVSTVTPEIMAEVSSLNLSGTTEEKVKKLYQYMQNKTRYVNVAVGIGGWQPVSADDVRKKGYGDCKGLSNYMRTLLTAAGIKSYYAIIESGETPENFDVNFPRMDGNHIILYVPTEKGNIWLENTSQKVAFNHLSYHTTNRNVLAVKENGIEIINTPVYTAEQSKEILSSVIKINVDNSIDVNANFNFTGSQYDFRLPLDHMNDEDKKTALKETYENLRIENLSVENFKNDRENAQIDYSMKFKVNDYAKKIGEDILFKAVPFNDRSAVSSTEERKLPFELAFSYLDDYTIDFIIPEGYKVSAIPNSIQLTSEFGKYEINFSQDNQKITVKRKITINKNTYPKEKYQDYLAFRKKTVSFDNSKILITKK